MRKLLARSLLVFSLLSISLMLAQAQSCGLRDTFVVAQNSSLSFDILISDYFNDDLSDIDQGLCGIELGFVHQYVENFEVTLTSPAGQSINLIGPNSDDDFDFTFGTEWQIDFVNCGALAAPDPVFSPQWDNTQSENWVNFGQYFGSYHPYIGCLEDFNTGPVNGNWTISINNNPSNYLGAITFLNLVFCDSRGVECCFTTPGIFLNEDIIACEGADTLLIDPNRHFPLGLADTIEFGYAYLISQDGIYTQLDSILDFRDSLAGNYQVCGFSYRRDELVNLPDANNVLTIDEIRANLDGLTPWLCAELTMDCLDVEIAAKPDTTFLEERICIGDSVIIGLDTFHQTGEYIVDLLSYADCDSTIVLDLFVQDVQMTMVDSTLCLGDSSVVGSSVYYATGLYRDTLQSSELGCDSIVELSLTILDPVFTEINPTICAGSNYFVGDSLLQMAGVYEILLTTATGCDSLVTVDLQVLNPEATIGTTTPIDCNNPVVVLDGNESIPFDDLTFKWLDTDEMELGQASTLSVETAGVYILEVSQTLDGVTCISRDTMTIEDIRIYPIADPGPDTTLTCEYPLLLLGGDQTTIESNIQYEWQLLNQGHFTSNPLNRQVEVDSAGTYQFIVSNSITGCADTATVEVTVDQNLPIVDTGLGFELTCAILQDTLDGSASLVEDDFVLTWDGPCVEELPEAGLIVVNCLGEYSLNVYNPQNGCSDQATVMVTQNIEQPVAIIETPDTLNCIQLSVQLDGHLSTPTELIDYQWIDPQGSTLIGDQPQVNLPGIYDLIVNRQDNSCKDTASITVVQDTIHPIADIQANTILTCREPSVLLGGPLTSIGDIYSYQWLENGQPIAGQLTDTLRVNVLSTYSLIVENINNGCQDTTSTSITENFLPPPVVQAGSNQFLDCANESVQLQPDSTLFSNPVTYQWTGPCILEPSQDWGIYVDCPGTYFLEVTNVDNGCFGTDSVQVNLSDNYSIAELPSSLYLSCETGEVVIDTEGSSNGTQRWFLNDELLFLPGPNPTVSETGVYTLIIDNNQMTCSDTASVEVFVECEVRAIVAQPDTLSCRNESVILDASNSVGQGELSYQWSTMMDMGCIIGPSNLSSLEIVCPGDYQVIVSNEEINESDTLTISVVRDTLRPVVYAGENVMLDCIQTEAHLIGSVEGDATDFTVAWTNFATDDTLSQITDYYTSSSGVYLFTAENIINGCRRSDLVQVNLDTFTPGIAFGDEFFSCNEDSFRLQAFVQPVEGNYAYLWSRTGTGILDDADSLSVLIEEIGLYTFTVTNEENGCDSTATIEVFEENCEPCIQVGIVDTLNCQTDIVTLSGSFCQVCDGCTLQWSFNNEDIVDANSLSLDVSEAGNYTLTATDMTGLHSDTTVTVISMIEEPSFSLGPDLTKGCNDTDFTLSPQELSAEEPLQYEWFQLGETTVISDEAELVVSEIGGYRLVITQLSTGCSASDTINIYENFEEPIADAGNNQTITCGSTAIVLDGGNSTLTNASYNWGTSQANCLSGEESLNPIASCPGWYFLTVTNTDNGCTAIDSVEVFIDDNLPLLIPFPDTILSCIHPLITLTGNIPSDGGDYEYRWCELDDSGEEISVSCQTNQLEYEVITAGVYQFTVEDISTNCANSFDVNVSMDTLAPMVNAGEQDTLFCTLSSLALQGIVEENTTYSWSSTEDHTILDANNLMPTVFQPGWYVLTAESLQNGCTATDSVLIVRDEEIPVLEAGVDTILNCKNEQIELNATGETLSGQFEWLWTSPDGQIDYGTNTPTVGISDTAWYFVNLTDPVSGCQMTDSVFVGRDIRQPEAMINDFDNLHLTCFQDTLLLDASPSNSITGVGLAFDWQVIVPGNLFPDTQMEQIFTDSIGYYKLTIEDMGNGCLDTLYFNVSANLTPPELAFAIPDTITCAIEEVELRTIPPTPEEGILFEWTNPNLDVISTLESAVTDNSGWHYLQLQNEENGCLKSDSVLVHSNEVLPSILIDPPFPITCDREVVILDASASSSGDEFTYQWQGLGGNEILGEGLTLQDSTSLTGLYELVIINTETGCEAKEEVNVENDGQLITGLDIAVANPPCEGDLLGSISINDVIGGTPNFTYSLNNMGQGNISFFEDLAIGSYEIKVVDSQGCYRIETVEIIPASEFQVDLGEYDDIQLGDSLQLSPQFNRPPNSFNWYAPDYEGILTGLKPYITPFETQFVILEAFDENGCSSRDTIQIFVVNNRPNFIPSAFSPNGDGDNDFFTVYTSSDVVEIKTLRIFSRWGNMVFERNNFSPNDPTLGWDGTFQGQTLNTAVFVYYVELIYQDQWVEKVTGDVLLLNIE